MPNDINGQPKMKTVEILHSVFMICLILLYIIMLFLVVNTFVYSESVVKLIK